METRGRILAAVTAGAIACAGLFTASPASADSDGGNIYHFKNTLKSGIADYAVEYGDKGDVILIGDWDGDGVDTIAVRRGNTYHLRNSNTSGIADLNFTYGDASDEILIGDWNGDGKDSVMVRRGNKFFVRNSLTTGVADREFMYGDPGDAVIAGDWNGDGTDTITVRRGNTYYVNNSLMTGIANIDFKFGDVTDQTYAGDWDGNGTDTLTVRRGNRYYVSIILKSPRAQVEFTYGDSSDFTYVGDWDGNKTDTFMVNHGPAAPAGQCQALNDGRTVYPNYGANRVSLVIADSYGTSYATFVNCVRQRDGFYAEEWSTSARIGVNGMARWGEPAAWRTMKTPPGSYSVTEGFGVYNPGTRLAYRQLNPQSKWGGTPGVNYNRYYEAPKKVSKADEDMWAIARTGDYRLGVVVNHNRPPDSRIVEGAGYAIFLHARKIGTAGCIALHESEVARYMRSAQPGDRIIMGVRSEMFR
ncbi:hypothetical protein QP762_03655 [Actinobaculum massiliense]|nr:hypothetical protein [Actinobaculum massiliense]